MRVKELQMRSLRSLKTDYKGAAPMERNVKYLIIGAGISGLTFANYADGGLSDRREGR